MSEDNPFDHGEIDDVIHGRLRLGVMAYLASVESALFTELRDKVNATDGNLSTHLRKLEEAGYVEIRKAFENRKPQTTVVLTREGRTAWISWIDRMRAIMNAAE